jgi:ATP-dependent exoDNAse (exonuclease V) alpha subunit
MYQNIVKLRENPDTANIGKKWSEDEINELLTEIKKNTSLKEIALLHKRTESSIKGKLFSIAISLIKKKMSLEEVSKIVNINSELITEHMNKYPDKKITPISSESKKDKSVAELLEINIQEEKQEIILNSEQELALTKFKSGKNIFLTGPAGTGKSVTLNKIKEYCFQKGKKFGITATTGTAAFILGGKTLHSFLGIGMGKESAEEIFKFVRYKLPHVATKLRECDVLIIDEISMLDKELFDKISDYLQIMRKNTKPFGGIQLVLTGDFCQLEPVSGDYCFKSENWDKLDLKIIYLHKLIRQDGDIDFQNILSKVRYGKCSDEIFEKLSSLKNKEFGEIKPTILYPRNFDVEKINKLESDKLIESGAKKETYKILYSNSKYKDKTQRWIKSLDLPEAITICVGDQVVVTTNIDQELGIVNGTRGIVTDVKTTCVTIKKIDDELIKINYYKSINAEDTNLNISYMPLKLAYALSIHKSQGMTLDAIEIDIGSKIFAAGQAYTALSRAKNLDSIKIKNISKNSFIINPDVLQFYEQIEENMLIDNIINKLFDNIITHTNLDNSLDFVWEFIPEDKTDMLEFFDNYSLPKLSNNSDDYLKLKNYLNKLKNYLINNELIIKKLRELNIIL